MKCFQHRIQFFWLIVVSQVYCCLYVDIGKRYTKSFPPSNTVVSCHSRVERQHKTSRTCHLFCCSVRTKTLGVQPRAWFEFRFGKCIQCTGLHEGQETGYSDRRNHKPRARIPKPIHGFLAPRRTLARPGRQRERVASLPHSNALSAFETRACDAPPKPKTCHPQKLDDSSENEV